MVDMPTASDIIGFDRGYMLGYIHCLEQMYQSLTDPKDMSNFHPKEIADRISVLIVAARKELNEVNQAI